MRKPVALLILIQTLWTGGVQALPLKDYNLILLEDYHYQGGEVEGRSIIGGSLYAQGQSPTFGTRLTRPASGIGLEVAGDVHATNINLNGGHMAYGGELKVSGQVNNNGGGEILAESKADLGSLKRQLYQGTRQFASWADNASLVGDSLQYQGSDSQAVFHLQAEQLFAQNNALQLEAGGAEQVLINVAGTDITAGGGVNLTGAGFAKRPEHDSLGASRIVWNFYEATRIDFGNLAMVGSVLAPYADITGGAVFDGSVAALSYTGAREFHDYEYVPPPPPTPVPEPGAAALLCVGALGLWGCRRRAHLRQYGKGEAAKS